ncbi:NAD kinase [Novosphingobium mangrovi (ex Huang et al. 2023)]|uniref:NAD kinase n=1 Tax=Novosphingobium mangrovi (ex Huang et al. 2023) TaxID=2976432 RepID=A0ABT2I883_9SPHN|nr:NAD kinase [Novosphingobium mangrovi (ex Huang et al. 2023)]MCT2401019.1 NAD kinase [Novosphingobium mangrovi (ex Huang et al. 2023)]
MNDDPKLALIVSDSAKAQAGARVFRDSYPWVSPEEADVLVVLGGDGFLLHVLHEMLHWDVVKPVYGMNLGTVGFLMNGPHDHVPIARRVTDAHRVPVRPLCMEATTQDGEEFSFYAINEVSLLRETRQTAKLEVRINGRVRMEELAGDGILIATPVGSTAYNLSANGPILPLGSRMLALTPISPFRPRRWKGAILPESAEVEFRIREPAKRPVAAVADQKEVRDVSTVRIAASAKKELTLLFDPGYTLEERIFAEQFQV